MLSRSRCRKRRATYRYATVEKSSADLKRGSSRNDYPNCCCEKTINRKAVRTILCQSRIRPHERHETIVPQELARQTDGPDRGNCGLVPDQEKCRRGA